MQIMNVNDRRLRENAVEWNPSSMSDAEVSNQVKTDDMAGKEKEERKEQI